VTPLFYPVYGKVLRSETRFPELREIPRAPHRWDFRVVDTLPDEPGLELLGDEPIYDDVCARFYRHASGFRIEVDDTGVFDISPCGSEIRWRPNPDPWWDFGRAHLLGRVLATTLHLDGVVTLHGSAVRMGDGVAAFLAPKCFGKSTLALRLIRAGGRFVTDDTLPVELVDGVPLAWPGVGAVRLDEETAKAERVAGGAGVAGRDGKVFVAPEGRAPPMRGPAPLSAVYLLRPVRDDAAAPAVVREPLPGPEAVIRLMAEMKIGEMLGPSGVALPLRVAAAVTSRTPVRTLSVVRNLDRMDEVVEQLVRWHGLPDTGCQRAIRRMPVAEGLPA
jgi:hypothetical protein